MGNGSGSTAISVALGVHTPQRIVIASGLTFVAVKRELQNFTVGLLAAFQQQLLRLLLM